jgi:hypothetical protein
VSVRVESRSASASARAASAVARCLAMSNSACLRSVISCAMPTSREGFQERTGRGLCSYPAGTPSARTMRNSSEPSLVRASSSPS